MTSQTLRNHFRVAKKVCQPTHTVRRKIFATDKFRESLPNGGGRNIRDKNIREGGSDTLRNYYNITWLLCLCGSSDL